MHPFTLLGEPSRLKIVEQLAKHERFVWQLTETVGVECSISRSAISHHLRLMLAEGWVDVREDRDGRRYRLAWDALDRLDAAVESLFLLWESREGWPYHELLPLVALSDRLDPPAGPACEGVRSASHRRDGASSRSR